MSLSTVIFQLNNNNYSYLFNRAQLKLGATVYIEFDGSGTPKDFYSHPGSSAIAYYVMWIAPSQWYVVLQDKFEFENSFQERVFESINGYLDKEIVAKALTIAANDVRPEQYV